MTQHDYRRRRTSRALRSDIVCHARFEPGGEQHSGPVGDTGGGLVESGATRHGPFEVAVPREATTVELWFERRGPAATLGWDSRYGQNYSFPVIGKGLPVPEPPAAQRPDARVDEKRIRVLEDAARKQEHVMGTAARRVHTGLSIHALVKEVSASTDVWADIHVFDGADELIHAGNVTLQPRESTPNGTLFVWEDDVYQGSGGGSGMGVWGRPDAHTSQYRLYCQVAAPGVEYRAQVFTDGILHEFEVPADEEVSGAQAELRGSSS